ncbi:MAG: histidine phosphatase family protein [Pseudomonadota bacterium]|nr:histidine phosphatase family protein [Pseudomonadota bacterium]MDP1906102.1 histidine phosphatase family protein [Pseudomonadota bacterium]MDP2353178.1 histidine phosphatase family protein [Pseudomonadota bacterium]
MRVYLVRHGESEANIGGYINDDPSKPVTLTAKGRAQATTAAEALRAVAITHAYASRFPRARETAEIILAGRELSLTIDARLNERRSGLDGQSVEAFNSLVCADPVRIKPENGESFLEQMARLRAFLDEIAQRHPQGVVLAVSHENPILAVAALAGREAEVAARGAIGNCEWLLLEWPSESLLTPQVAYLEDEHHSGEGQRDAVGEDDRPA